MAGMPPVFAQSSATQNTSAEPTGGFNIELGVEDDRGTRGGQEQLHGSRSQKYGRRAVCRDRENGRAGSISFPRPPMKLSS